MPATIQPRDTAGRFGAVDHQESPVEIGSSQSEADQLAELGVRFVEAIGVHDRTVVTVWEFPGGQQYAVRCERYGDYREDQASPWPPADIDEPDWGSLGDVMEEHFESPEDVDQILWEAIYAVEPPEDEVLDGHVQVTELAGEPTRVTPGVLDEAAEFAFSHGQCHAFAQALHERTGWPIVAVGHDECNYNISCAQFEDDPCDCQINHTGVRTPDGKFADVYGVGRLSGECRWVNENWDDDERVPVMIDLPPDRFGRVVSTDQRVRAGGWIAPATDEARSMMDVWMAKYAA